MSVNYTVNGTVYPFPETNETGWGDAVTDWAGAVTTGMLSKAGGSFILTSEVDFGATYGVKLPYLKSRTASPATTGFLRLAASDGMYWRNPANNANYGITMDGSGQLLWRGVVLSTGSALTAADVANVPSGNLVATNVQTALNELQTEIDDYAASVRTFTNKSISGATNTITNIPNSATTGTTSVLPDTLVLRDGSANIWGNTIYGNQASFLMLNVEDGGLGTITTDFVQAGIVSASNVVGSVSLEAPLVTSGVATLNVRTRVADGASAVGMKFFTFTPLVTAGAKPFTFENGSEIAYFDHSGDFNLLHGLTVSNAVNADEVFASYVEAGASGLYNAGDSTLVGTVTAGPLISNSLTANAGQTLLLKGGQADGASAVGLEFRMANNYTVSGAKQFRWTSNNGAFENGHVDKDNQFRWAGNLSGANVVAGGIFGSSSAAPVHLTGIMNNGATAIGAKIEAANTLSTSGANIAIFSNGGTEKLAVTKDGNLDFLNGTAVLNYVSGSDKFAMNKSLDITTGSSTLYSDYGEFGFDMNIYGSTYCQNGLSTDIGANVATGQVFADVFQPNGNKYLTFYTNAAAGDTTPADTLFETTVTRTAGTAFQVNNNTAELFRLDYDNNGYINNLKIAVETPAFLASIAPKERVMTLPTEDWRAGGTAPGHGTFGSAPRKSGWEFTAAGAGNQELELFFDVPDDIDVNYACYLDLAIMLTAAETVGDTCDFTVQYVSTAAPGSLAGTATTETRDLTVVTGKNTAGTMYSIALQLDPLDITNPLNTADCHAALGLKRSTAGTIGTVLLLGVCFKYTSKI